MKFISIDKPTAAMGMLPPDVTLQLLEVSIAKMEQLREQRKIIEYYVRLRETLCPFADSEMMPVEY